jgi:hypothetical protein
VFLASSVGLSGVSPTSLAAIFVMYFIMTIKITIVIAIASLSCLVALKGVDSLSSIMYETFLSLFTSSVFFAATVIVPENRRRRIVRKGLEQQYLSFKKRSSDLFLIASESQDYEYRDNLLNHQEFRRYFSIRITNDQSRWDLVATSIDDQDYIFREIVREFDFLDREIEFARSSVQINDVKVEQFFINLRQVIHSIKGTEAHSDDCKHFCRTLWSIFTRWNFIDGQLEEDIIESMIKNI